MRSHNGLELESQMCESEILVSPVDLNNSMRSLKDKGLEMEPDMYVSEILYSIFPCGPYTKFEIEKVQKVLRSDNEKPQRSRTEASNVRVCMNVSTLVSLLASNQISDRKWKDTVSTENT